MSKKIYWAEIMETLAVLTLLKFGNLPSALFFLSLHLISSWIVALSLKMLLKKSLRRGSVKTFTSILFLSGPVGYVLILLLYIVLMLKRRRELPIYENVSLEVLPEVEFIGRKAGESFVRVKSPAVVIYMSRTRNPRAIRYLKEALADEEDEVRLTAFSTLSSIESEIINRVSLLKSKLDKAGEGERFYLLFSLAELYWEIVYTNVADRELEHFYLGEAEGYALKALELKEDPRLCFLIGRIYMRKGDYEKAEDYLSRAMELDFPKERILPYLLEIFYKKRDLRKLYTLAKRFKDVVPSDPVAASIIKVWI